MSDKKFVVHYVVEGFGARMAGPYESQVEAEEHASDIRGFDGVSEVYVGPAPEVER